MMRSFRKALISTFAGLALSFGAGSATADTFSYILSLGNTSAIGSGPFGTVTVTTSGTAADIVFAARTDLGYAFVDTSAADVNVSTTNYTLSNLAGVVSSLAPSGATVGLSSASGAANVDGFGQFNLRVSNHGAWSDALSQISFTLTNTVGNWASASTVLVANALGNAVAAHMGYCASLSKATCSAPGFVVPTGFATVPIPAAAWLFGSGLVGLIAIARRRIKGGDASALA